MPRDTSAFSLLDVLSETGFQASVIATYSCYFPFYEEVILRRLMDRGCTNNILLVDARRCAEAFAGDDTRPRRAGRDYTLIPVHLRGAFHPKLIVALGKTKGVLFVGSHNATLAGFGLNDEVTNAFRTSGTGARQGAAVIRSALDYLRTFVPSGLTELGLAVDSVKRNIPWLEGPMAVESDERMLLTTTGADDDLWSRIRGLIPDQPSTAFVCGPFFDGELGFLERIRDDVRPRRFVVGIDPESVEISPHSVSDFHGAEFVNVAGLAPVPNRREAATRYLHAKILWFSSPNGELLVTGSANPSAPAFLATGDFRNAEAVVVDRRKGAADILGLEMLLNAPRIEPLDWTRIAERQAARVEENSDARGTVVLAIPSEEGFILEQPIGRGIALDAFGADGGPLGRAVVRDADESAIEASDVVRDTAQMLRSAGSTKKPVIVLVHRPDEVARNVGGDRQRELRRALGAFEEDPSQLDALLKLTEKVIFDSDDVVTPEPAIRRKSQSGQVQEAEAGPESLAVDAIGRHAGRKKKRLASGDILVLLDALIARLGEGPAAPTPSRPPTEEERPVADDDKGDEETPPPPPPFDVLADMCRGKVGRLVRRMARQLEAARTGSARRAVVQLAAVLSVLHTLRTVEQRTEWRSKHLKLVDPDHEHLLFEAASLALNWSASSLGPRAVEEWGGEDFQELSIATGLLGWLAWELGIDVRAAVERTSPIDLMEEDVPWYAVQLFATIALSLAGDGDARDTFRHAVSRTGRKGVSTEAWVTTHLALADRIAEVAGSADSLVKSSRAPIAGDLIVLGTTVDPRIRAALEVVPSGATHKITVLDLDDPDGKRQFLASHVKYVGWFDESETPRRSIGA